MTEKTEKAPKERQPTIGDAAIEAIRAGKSNEEALAAVKDKFPTAKTTLASINWYRNKLRGDGEKVPSARELKKAAKAAQPPKEKKSKKKQPDAAPAAGDGAADPTA